LIVLLRIMQPELMDRVRKFIFIQPSLNQKIEEKTIQFQFLPQYNTQQIKESIFHSFQKLTFRIKCQMLYDFT